MTGKFASGGAALGVVVGSVIALSPLASGQSHPRLTEQGILRIALRAAAASGDSRPSLVQHSEGTHSNANQVLSGGYFGGSAWSYLIAERGHFVGYQASTPPGAPLPRGTVITLVVNAATGRVTDSGISYRYPPLRQLGPVRTDYRTYPSCPVRDRQQLVSTTPGTEKLLVPPGARQVLICRYGGLNAGRSKLRLVHLNLVSDRNTVTRLADEFDALPPFGKGTIVCPADVDRNIIAIFRYQRASKSDDPVTVNTSGCTPVTNGHLLRIAAFPPGRALTSELQALARHR